MAKKHLLHNHARAKVEVVPDNLQKLIFTLFAGSIREYCDRERLSNANGVRDLDKGTAAQFSCY